MSLYSSKFCQYIDPETGKKCNERVTRKGAWRFCSEEHAKLHRDQYREEYRAEHGADQTSQWRQNHRDLAQIRPFVYQTTDHFLKHLQTTGQQAFVDYFKAIRRDLIEYLRKALGDLEDLESTFAVGYLAQSDGKHVYAIYCPDEIDPDSLNICSLMVCANALPIAVNFDINDDPPLCDFAQAWSAKFNPAIAGDAVIFFLPPDLSPHGMNGTSLQFEQRRRFSKFRLWDHLPFPGK